MSTSKSVSLNNIELRNLTVTLNDEGNLSVVLTKLRQIPKLLPKFSTDFKSNVFLTHYVNANKNIALLVRYSYLGYIKNWDIHKEYILVDVTHILRESEKPFSLYVGDAVANMLMQLNSSDYHVKFICNNDNQLIMKTKKFLKMYVEENLKTI